MTTQNASALLRRRNPDKHNYPQLATRRLHLTERRLAFLGWSLWTLLAVALYAAALVTRVFPLAIVGLAFGIVSIITANVLHRTRAHRRSVYLNKRRTGHR